MSPRFDASAAAFVREALARHQDGLLRYAARILGDPERARDVVQETFLRLWKQDPADVDDHLPEWLYTVCRRCALDVLRKEGRMSRFEEGEIDRVPSVAPHPGDAVEARDSAAQAAELINRLPPRQQEVIRLKFQVGFSYKEISRVTGLSIGNVGFIIHNAVKSLRSGMSTDNAVGRDT
jgi:RNA polymerase sigma factor (sigma-70 family)